MQVPSALIQSLTNVAGFNQQAFEQVHFLPQPVTSIRLNPFKHPSNHSNIINNPANTAIPWCLQGKYLPARPSFTFDPLFHAGAYYVQEASSMFLWHLLTQIVGNKTQQKVLDLCAAPGGKSTLLASYFSNGLVVSNEVLKPRASVLVENMTKWGADNVVVTNNDPAHFKALPNFFDVMVIDAPCSGSGLFRKDAKAVEEWSLDNVNLCHQRQQRILADALPALKPGGILIYATCSYSKAENENICDWIMDNHAVIALSCNVPAEWGIVTTQSDKHHATGYRFYPYLVAGEGFFIAAFQKQPDSDNANDRYKEQPLTLLSKTETMLMHNFMPIAASHQLFKQNESTKAMPQQWWQTLQQLAKQLYIKKAGIEIGTIKGKDIIPHHELALSKLPLHQFNTTQLNEADALNYLRRKEWMVSAPKGWCLVEYCGLSLGWVKVLPNRINNYYPNEWRILKG